MASLIKLFYFFIFIFILPSCSFKNPAGFFEDQQKELEKEIAKKNSKLVFIESKKFTKEVKGIFEGKLIKPINNISWLEKNFTPNNYIPHLEYNDTKSLFYKSKKLGKNKFNISGLSFEPIVFENNIFLYDLSGNIFKFSIEKRKLIWKFNFYKKRYKNIPIQIKFKITNNNLVVSDNLGYLYKLKIDSGDLVWAKNYGVPFKSNIKTKDSNIFLLNQDNKFYIVGENDGETLINFETFPSLLKSQQETNISLDPIKNSIYFITSTGRFYSINYKTKNINWLLNLSMTTTNRETGGKLFFSSPIIHYEDKIFLSNSVSTFSIDSKNGFINWELPFSTSLRPIVTKNFLVFASKNGFILNLDPRTGKVLWSKNLFQNNKKFKIDKIGSIQSLLLISNKILATTTKGFFLFIDYKDGKILNYTKASGSGFFSAPSLAGGKIYIVDKKMKILVFD